jgi:hypothetical protein
MSDAPTGTRRIAAALGFGFFVLYLSIGLLFYHQAPRVLRHIDQLFDADIPSRVIDLTHAQGGHERTEFHPLFVLLLNPVGHSLREVLRWLDVGGAGAGSLAAIFMCAVAGGATAAVFFGLLRRLGLAAPMSTAWTLMYGLSASQLLFASLPESFVFSAASLVVLFWCAARPEPPRGLLAASIASFGMVVTNVVAITAVRARWLDPRRPAAALRALTVHLVLVVAITGALSLVQLFFYPGAETFLAARRMGHTDQSSFVALPTTADKLARAGELTAHFLLFDLAAPRLVVTETGGPRTVVDFEQPSASALRAPLGMLHAALWVGLLIAAAVLGLRSRLYREPLALALLAWIAFNVALHSVFGVSLFLYSAQWTFAVVALAAWAIERMPGHTSARLAVLAGTIAAQVAVNVTFFRELLAIYAIRPS